MKSGNRRRVDDTNCAFLHVFEQVGLGNGQTRVPDWTRVLKDRPHYSSVEVQQVPGRDIHSPQLFEKVFEVMASTCSIRFKSLNTWTPRSLNMELD